MKRRSRQERWRQRNGFSKLVRSFYGRAVPDFDFTRPISALFIKPSVVTSSRKLELVTACPDCDLVWPISAELTTPSPLVSPISTFIDPAIAGLKLPAESVTLLKLMVITCALVTPV